MANNKDKGRKENKKTPIEKPVILGKRRTKLKDSEKRHWYVWDSNATPNNLNHRPKRVTQCSTEDCKSVAKEKDLCWSCAREKREKESIEKTCETEKCEKTKFRRENLCHDCYLKERNMTAPKYKKLPTRGDKERKAFRDRGW